jgi:hypothetical protein
VLRDFTVFTHKTPRDEGLSRLRAEFDKQYDGLNYEPPVGNILVFDAGRSADVRRLIVQQAWTLVP